jgi:chemotaxis protein histidine kinase CheA
MELLDKIMQMQNQGIPEAEIYRQLQNEGISPSQINDAINQAKVKNAVSPPEAPQAEAPAQVAPEAPQAEAPAQPQPEVYPPENYQQQEQAPAYQPDPIQQDYYQETPQGYSPQDYYSPQAGTSTETISEIAEQVVIEKLNEYKNQTGDILSFKNTIQDKVSNIDDRLKRIENSIDQLQQAIIGKVGELGESNAMIHKDLDNLHGTVSNLMNPLIDNVNEMKKVTQMSPPPKFEK